MSVRKRPDGLHVISLSGKAASPLPLKKWNLRAFASLRSILYRFRSQYRKSCGKGLLFNDRYGDIEIYSLYLPETRISFMGTLQIDSVLLHEAEQAARLHNADLTQVVESFIRRYIEQTKKGKRTVRVTPFVEQLGVDLDLPADFDEKEAYRRHLEEKYK